jgi:type I restriction enzyme M protein
MVEMLDPKPTEVVGDPACGMAGFLVSTMEHIWRRKYSSPELVETFEDGSKVLPRRSVGTLPGAHSEQPIPRLRLRCDHARASLQ